MQYTSPPFWLMIVSSAIAVLPVWRSPMMSSRWPRPIGVIASIALRPVWSGWFTLLRATMPGAFRSTRRVSFVSIGPLPSIGLPSASTTRPSRASPTGTSTMRRVRRTRSPSRTWAASPMTATPTLSLSRLSTMPRTPPGNSTSSPAITDSRPKMRAMPSPIESTVPVSATSISRPYSRISRFRMSVISPGLMSMLAPTPCPRARGPAAAPVARWGARPRARSLPRQALAQLAQLRAQRAVVDHVAHLRDDASEQRRLDGDGERHLAPDALRERLPDPLALLVAELARRADARLHDPRPLVGEPRVLGADRVEHHQPAAVDQIREKMTQQLARAEPLGHRQHHAAALGDGVQRLEQHVGEALVRGQQPPERVEVAAHLAHLAGLLGELEQRVRVAACGGGAGHQACPRGCCSMRATNSSTSRARSAPWSCSRRSFSASSIARSATSPRSRRRARCSSRSSALWASR